VVSSAAIPLYRKCSSRGPQLSLHRCLKAERIPAAASALPVGGDAGQRVESERELGIGNVEVTNLVGWLGRHGINDGVGEVTVGSMTAAPSPAVMSCMARLKRVVDLPLPDLPTMYTWRARSSRESAPLEDLCRWVFGLHRPARPRAENLVVNLKAAKALGLNIPESFLLRADDVVE
jgi:hypothetical protein